MNMRSLPDAPAATPAEMPDEAPEHAMRGIPDMSDYEEPAAAPEEYVDRELPPAGPSPDTAPEVGMPSRELPGEPAPETEMGEMPAALVPAVAPMVGTPRGYAAAPQPAEAPTTVGVHSLPHPEPHARALPVSGGGKCGSGACVENYKPCGGAGMKVSKPCCEGICIAANPEYAACLPHDDVATYVHTSGWDGTPLDCEPMPAAVKPMPLEPVEVEPMCDPDAECKAEQQQCGGAGFDVSAPCCKPDHVCTIRDGNFAACLPRKLVHGFVRDYSWYGETLKCEAMPADLVDSGGSPSPTGDAMVTMTRRLLASQDDAQMRANPADTAVPADSSRDASRADADASGAADASSAAAGGSAAAAASARSAEPEQGKERNCAAPRTQCAALGWPAVCCAGGTVCVKQSESYAECVEPDAGKALGQTPGWDGTVLQPGAEIGGNFCSVCANRGEQCGSLFSLTRCCAGGLHCVQKTFGEARCIRRSEIRYKQRAEQWLGDIAACGRPLPLDWLH